MKYKHPGNLRTSPFHEKRMLFAHPWSRTDTRVAHIPPTYYDGNVNIRHRRHCFVLLSEKTCRIVVAGLILLPAAVAAAPHLEAPFAIHDFGWRDATETVTNRFVLRNTGDADLHLTAIKTSCGCTRAEPATRVIAPGAETVLEVHLALRGLQGQQRKSVSVLSDDPATPNLTLWMQGEARAAVCLEPPAFSFGRILPAEPPAAATVRLGGHLTATRMTKAVSDNPAFPVSLGTDGRSLLLGPPALTLPGAHRATVTVTLSCADRGTLSLPVYAWLDDLLRIHPEILAYRANQPAEAPVSRIVIVRRGAAPRFHVTAVRLEGVRGEASFQTRSDGAVHVRVSPIQTDTIAPDAALVIVTDLSERPEWRVPIRIQN